MAFYLIGPDHGLRTKIEPLLALGIAIVWRLRGIYFVRIEQGLGHTTIRRSAAASSWHGQLALRCGETPSGLPPGFHLAHCHSED